MFPPQLIIVLLLLLHVPFSGHPPSSNTSRAPGCELASYARRTLLFLLPLEQDQALNRVPALARLPRQALLGAVAAAEHAILSRGPAWTARAASRLRGGEAAAPASAAPDGAIVDAQFPFSRV